MRTTVGRWGNSLALRLPRHVADQARLAEGATVELEIEDGCLRVTPTRKRVKLSELLADERPDEADKELDWGKPAGEEAW